MTCYRQVVTALTQVSAFQAHGQQRHQVLPTECLRQRRIRQDQRRWRAAIGWSGLIVSSSSACGLLERCFPAQADNIPMRCAA